jgi:hypothetical protein
LGYFVPDIHCFESLGDAYPPPVCQNDKVEGTEPYKSNYEKFIKRYPGGFPPVVIGCPVIG